jgi:nucleotide-binding universal stress UspA family protein
MSYKTVLVHSDTSVHAAGRIRLAAQVANSEGAHLVGVAVTGMSRFMFPETVAPLTPPVVTNYADTMHEHARQALDSFLHIARAEGVASHEARLVSDDPEGALVLMSRYADLVVLSQTDPAYQVAGAVRQLPEYVMLNSARPVLVVPYAGRVDRLYGNAMVAWDGSVEAARALGGALPLLRRATAVTVAQFQRGEVVAPATQAADLTAWLARHGIRISVAEQHVDIDDGNALLSLAADTQAGLLVMGGYGHSRLRELLLGGVTKTVLESMTVPVLMAH